MVKLKNNPEVIINRIKIINCIRLPRKKLINDENHHYVLVQSRKLQQQPLSVYDFLVDFYNVVPMTLCVQGFHSHTRINFSYYACSTNQYFLNIGVTCS